VIRVTVRAGFVITDDGDIATEDGFDPSGMTGEMLDIAWKRAKAKGRQPQIIKAEGKWLEALKRLNATAKARAR
jgi:hypothetical protein